MEDLLLKALCNAMGDAREQAELVGLENVDESTFRSFVMAAICREDASVKVHTEWNRVDLLAQRGNENALVEFKYYVIRALKDLDGALIRWKGGAGFKNEEEFCQCIDKVREISNPRINYRYLVLAYENSTHKRTYSFSDNYDNLCDFGLDRVHVVLHRFDAMTCKLIDLTPTYQAQDQL